MRRAASRPVTKTPRPVALTRPSEPPRWIGLPVTTPVAVPAGVHRVRVHHPGHDLAVGVHVGRGDVALRADDDADLAGVAARHALELLHRQLLRIAADAALGAAVGQVHRGALDRHPGRQRHHLLERHVGVVAHAALARAARQVVLDPVALEVGDAAVVHLDRHVDDQRALRAASASRTSAPAGRGRAGRGRPATGRCARGWWRWGRCRRGSSWVVRVGVSKAAAPVGPARDSSPRACTLPAETQAAATRRRLRSAELVAELAGALARGEDRLTRPP